MSKICYIIPFYYKWDNYAHIRSIYEYLQKEGYIVDIFPKKENKNIDFTKYELVMLHGSGSFLTDEDYSRCKIPIFSFGHSDPNLFNEAHFNQGNIYCTNDLKLSKSLTGKPIYYYPTSCDQRYHINLKLEKTTDILTYGKGNHSFITNRNKVINKLRSLGFKIKCFGVGWSPHQDTYNFIEGQELSNEICKSHLLLDLSNENTSWSHRIFEGSARATPCLTYDREDTRQLLKVGDEVLVYETFEDIVEILNMLLPHPNDLRKIGLNAQKRCYADHDISIRIQELLKIIKENEL